MVLKDAKKFLKLAIDMLDVHHCHCFASLNRKNDIKLLATDTAPIHTFIDVVDG